MIISAYTVKTDTPGFVQCEWSATGLESAEKLAKKLSELHAANPQYPNSFWVMGSSAIVKYFKGVRYAPTASI